MRELLAVVAGVVFLMNLTLPVFAAGEKSDDQKSQATPVPSPGIPPGKPKPGPIQNGRGAGKPPRPGPGPIQPKPKPRGNGQKKLSTVQQALKEKGYDPGPIDGVMGPKTRAAITSFQQASGLNGTGELDDETAEKLGVAAIIEPPPPQPEPRKAQKPPLSK